MEKTPNQMQEENDAMMALFWPYFIGVMVLVLVAGIIGEVAR